MSIKTNLLIALFLVIAVMLATTGYLAWSSIGINRQLRKLAPSVTHLESIVSARASLTREMKEVVDCLITHSNSSMSEFNKAAHATARHLAKWEKSVSNREQDESTEENPDLQAISKINESYREWHALATNVMEFCRRNEIDRAKAVLSETSLTVLENSLLNEIDSAHEKAASKVTNNFNLLVMSLGRLPWSNMEALRTLEKIQSTVDSALAIARISTGISKQLKEVMDDLISPVDSLRPFGWSGNETTSAINDFRRSAARLVDLGQQGSSKLLSEAATIENHYTKFTILCQQAMSSRKAGDVIIAGKLAESVIEQVMKDGLIPDIEKSLLNSNADIEKIAGNVSRQGIFVVLAGAMIVIVTLIASLKGILNAFSILETETAAVTAGNLGHRIDLPETTELGRLAASFNTMTESLQKKDAELRNLNSELERRIEERTAQLATANNDLRLFSSSVCHDLKSPLSSISGYSQLLLLTPDETFDLQTRETLQRIVDSSAEMSSIISALMKLARVTEDEINNEQVDLTMIAHLVISELREREPERRVSVDIAEGIYALGDETLLKLVLENLIGNAWKYTSRKRDGRIEFGCRIDDGETIYHVSDNGAGFDMKMADSLFKPFGRLHSQEEFKGTGIGLATVKRIIERHHGRIWAESVADEGTKFFFTIGSPGSGS